jgi:hypothetical protein
MFRSLIKQILITSFFNELHHGLKKKKNAFGLIENLTQALLNKSNAILMHFHLFNTPLIYVTC